MYIRIQQSTFLHISKSLVRTFNYLGVIRKSITSKKADFFRQEEGGEGVVAFSVKNDELG